MDEVLDWVTAVLADAARAKTRVQRCRKSPPPGAHGIATPKASEYEAMSDGPSERPGSGFGGFLAATRAMAAAAEGENAFSYKASKESAHGLALKGEAPLDVFRRFALQNEICTDHFQKALVRIGHKYIRTAWVTEIIEERFQGRSFLDRDEFLQFTTAYQQRRMEVMQELFQQEDSDSSGTLSMTEIASMLRHKNITPLPGMVEELMREVGGGPEIHFEEYVDLYEIIHFRAGFTAADVIKLKAYFARYDRDNSGTLDVSELRAALSWAGRAGLAMEADALDALMAEVQTIKDSDVLEEDEYFRIMRLQRERDVAKIMSILQNRDEDGSGRLGLETLPGIFEDLGYAAASWVVLQEASVAANIIDSADVGKPMDLSFEDICLVLDHFAEAEGFTKVELAELEAVFAKYRGGVGTGEEQLPGDDEECGNFIGPIGLEGALRWLGYPAALWQLQELLDQFDLDDRCQLSYGEFLKLMATLREAEHQQIRRAIAAADARDAQKEPGTIPVNHLLKLVSELGYSPTPEQQDELVWEAVGENGEARAPMAVFDVWAAARALRCHRLDVSRGPQENHGFSAGEVQRFKQEFSKQDPKSTGRIPRRSVYDMLKELFPDADNIQHVLPMAGRSVNRDIDFNEYLQMMRTFYSYINQARLAKEMAAVREAGFSREEVREFRRIFRRRASTSTSAVRRSLDAKAATNGGAEAVKRCLHIGDGFGTMDLRMAEVERMVRDILRIKEEEFQREFEKLLDNFGASSKIALDFGEFLLLMHKLLHDNWQNINSVAADMCERDKRINGGNCRLSSKQGIVCNFGTMRSSVD